MKTILIVVFLLLIMTGCEEERVYQTSEYACNEGLISSIARIWIANNIKTIDGHIQWEEYRESIQIKCPKCTANGAFVEFTEDCTRFHSFINEPITLGTIKVGESKEVWINYDSEQWYCAKCLYPLGTDWKIIIKE